MNSVSHNNFPEKELPKGEKDDVTRRKFLVDSATAVGHTALVVSGLQSFPLHADEKQKPVAPAAPEKPIDIMTAAELQSLLPKRLHRMPLSDVLKHGCACVDGRNEDKEGVAGIPGGDAGIALAAMTEIESQLGRPLTADECDALVDSFSGAEYFHTDHHALHGHDGHQGLLAKLREDPELKNYFPSEQKTLNILLHDGLPEEATDAEVNRLLDILSRAESQGCGHLKNAMKDPRAYGVREGAASQIVRSSYRRLWKNKSDEKRAVLDPLDGKDHDHQERAIAVVELPDDLTPDTLIPVLEPNARDGGQFFVLTPKIAIPRLREVFTGMKNKFPALDEDGFMRKAQALLERQTAETAKRLADGRHLLKITQSPDAGGPQVTDIGTVGT